MKINQEILDTYGVKLTAFYYVLKSSFRNPIFLDYSPEKIALRIHLSPNTVRKYVSTLKGLGMVEKRGKHLCIIGYKQLDLKSRYVKVRKQSSYKDLVTEIEYQFLRENIRNQEYILNNRLADSGSNKADITVSGYKKYKKLYSRNYSNENVTELTPTVKVSSRMIARIFGVSDKSGWNILKKLEKNNFLKYKEIIEQIDYNEYLYRKYNNFHVFKFKSENGELYFIHRGIEIKFLDENVNLSKNEGKQVGNSSETIKMDYNCLLSA